jgi:HD-like signal output (HDOD) protein
MPVSFSPTRDVLLSTARKLPASPQVLGGLCELLQDVNTDLDQLAEEIRVDFALASRVIRLSNSVVFGGGGSLSTVEEAVSRVGFSEVIRLVGAATVTGLADRTLECYRLPADAFRESLLMHALASETLAGFTGLDRRTAYVGGLLRGIGMMVLERYAREQIPANETFDPKQFETYQQWENARFSLSAADVTSMALDDWRFPSELLVALENHLQPNAADEEHRFAVVLNLAGAITAKLEHALPGELTHWTLTPEKLAAVGMDDEQFASALDQTHTIFEHQRQALY